MQFVVGEPETVLSSCWHLPYSLVSTEVYCRPYTFNFSL